MRKIALFCFFIFYLEMQWIIVKFTEFNEIEVIPERWYDHNKKMILYPPYSSKQQIEKAIKHEILPEEKTWKEYKVELIRKDRYTSFKLACAKASKACLHSDVSETEAPVLSKRIPKPKHLSSSETSSDESLKNVPLQERYSPKTGKYFLHNTFIVFTYHIKEMSLS